MKTSPLRRFFLPVAAAALTVLTVPTARAQTIPKGSLIVDLQPFATLPGGPSGEPARAHALTTAPDGRLFVDDQRGKLYFLAADTGAATLYLDLASLTPLLSDGGERGFQGIAFHPDFNAAGAAGYGKFYTMASQTDTGKTATFAPGVSGAGRDHDEVLLEWTAADPAAAAFAAVDPAQPFREVLRIARPNSNHNAGFIAFNPTAAAGSPDRGNLYIGTGDSGGGGDPLGLAQMLGKAYGAILRIDPLAPAAGAPLASANGRYSIPADNPFVANPAFLREKFAAGFRNPQRFTWDKANGRLFIADIGQGSVEEVDLGAAGANYGWNKREGSFVYNANGGIGANVRADAATTGYTYPVAEYRHFGSNGNGVTLGLVCRGAGVPGLAGQLLFSDFVNGIPYTINADSLPDGGSGAITELRLRVNGAELSFLDIIRQAKPDATRADLRFGTDGSDNIYFLNKQDGIIRRVVQTAPTPVTPAPTPTPTPTPPPVTPAPPLPESVSVSLSVKNPIVSRAADRQGVVKFVRTGDTSAPLAVHYKVGGGGVAGRDYAPVRGTKVIPVGQTGSKLKISPLAGGSNAKVTITILPGAGYNPDGVAKKVKITLTD